MPEGWADPAVPPQQHHLQTTQFAAWQQGRPFAPFDAFAACASRVVFMRPQPTVLDLGCGAGGWLALFRHQWPDCWILGVDASPAMVAFATATYGAAGRAAYVEGDQRDLAFIDAGTVDLVHHGCCLIHLPPDDWGTALREAARVVAPHGYVLVSKTPIARHRPKHWRHAAYGTQIPEWYATWAQYAAAYTAAGLEPIWEEQWDENADPFYVTTLFQRKAA